MEEDATQVAGAQAEPGIEAPAGPEAPVGAEGAGRRRKLLRRFGIAAIVLVVLGAVGVTAGVVVSADNQRKAAEAAKHDRELAREADDQLQEIFETIETRDELWRKPIHPTAWAIETDITFTRKTLKDLVDKKIPAVRKTVSGCSSKEIREDYGAVCAELERVLRPMDGELAKTLPLVAPFDKLEKADGLVEQGKDCINETIDLGNDRKYGEGQKRAQTAKSDFEMAVRLYAEVAKGDKSPEIAARLKATRQRVVEAEANLELMRLGARHASASRYNGQIDRADREAARCGSLEALAGRETPGERLWARIKGVGGMFTQRASKARDLWDDAKETVEKLAG